MSKLCITGGEKLYGSVKVQSAKNSVLPLIACSVLYENEVRIKNCKKISDIVTMCEIFKGLGGKYYFDNDTLVLKPQKINDCLPSENLSTKIRASFFLAGALLSRFGKAEMILPGGCNIGKRPVDVHIDALKKLGYLAIDTENKVILQRKNKIKGTKIKLNFPSVGATENLIMASVFCDGEVVLENVAKEPEIVDLQDMLNLFGCSVSGAGTNRIKIKGVKKLKDEKIEFTPIGDRIEAGTYMLATASCGGEITINNIYYKNIYYIGKKISQNNCKIYIENDKINVIYNNRGVGFGKIQTKPFPFFPTDLQAPFCVLAGISNGYTQIYENLFENRFGHIKELEKMGLDAKVKENSVSIQGVRSLHGAKVVATDLRAGAALIIAGLCAEGYTEIENVDLIDRGYYQIEKTFSLLGGKITREEL